MPKKSFYLSDSLKNCLYLMASVSLVWFWTGNVVLANYSLQLTAFLIIFYFIARFFLNKKGLEDKQYILDTTIFTAALLLILSATGGLSSPLFFLVYFLFFATALLFDSVVTLTLTLTLTLFFASTLNSLHSALQMISLLIFSPMAIYFGKQYLHLLEAQERIKILHKEKKLLSTNNQQQSANLANEETHSLLWLSLNFKNGLLKIVHVTADLLADIGHLSGTQKENLQSIHDTAKDLLKSGEKLKEKIDKETD